MDIRLYSRVIWRFRYLVFAGILLAVGLTFLSFFRVTFEGGSPGISYRQQEIWQASETMHLTQSGFPEGQIVPTHDPNRFAALAQDYATFANGDAIRAMADKGGTLGGKYVAQPLVDRSLKGAVLPYVVITGFATSRPAAIRVAERVTSALRTYITRSQEEAQIPPRSRILTKVTTKPEKATLAQGRRLTVPIVVFLTVLIATIGLAFILENLRPAVRPVSSVPDSRDGEDQRAAGSRR